MASRGRAHALLCTVALLGAIITSATEARAGSTEDKLFREANKAYAQGKPKDQAGYHKARKLYEEIIRRGIDNEVLYYNLGNTYYRLGQYGRTIWAYERALRIAPEHRETKYNLGLVWDVQKSRVKDKIVGSQKQDWWQRVVAFFTVTSATGWFLLLWYLTFGLVGAALLLGWGVLRKSLIVLAVLVGLLALGFGRIYLDRIALEQRVTAILLDDKIELHEAARGISTVRHTIQYAGLKVELIAREDQWVKIRLHNGIEGWIRAASAGEL